jgi:hypothetical protein
MDIDHIFVFTDSHEKITDELILFGLKANESRVHQGQGTANCTFSFDNFFLEIVWVHNRDEILSDSVMPSGLWQRANYFNNNYSRFGLILVNEKDTDHLFEKAYKYQPDYFPKGMAFDVIQNDMQPALPWTCRMPFKREKKSGHTSANHENGINTLTSAVFEYVGNGAEEYIKQFKNEDAIQFTKSDKVWLTLTFDNRRQDKTALFELLQLTMEY